MKLIKVEYNGKLLNIVSIHSEAGLKRMQKMVANFAYSGEAKDELKLTVDPDL